MRSKDPSGLDLPPQDSGDRVAAARAGLSAMLLWLAIEFSVRSLGLLVVLAPGRLMAKTMPPPGQVFMVNTVLLAVALPLLWIAFRRRVARDRLARQDLGYRWEWPAVLAGLAAAVGLLGVITLTAEFDSRLFGNEASKEFMAGLVAAGLPGLILLIPLNGIFAPIVEEYAWRAYVQRRLIAAWGPVLAVAATSAAFALKHVIVDLSFHRIATLLALSLGLGIVGWWRGTGASTVAHTVMNLTATSATLPEVL